MAEEMIWMGKPVTALSNDELAQAISVHRRNVKAHQTFGTFDGETHSRQRLEQQDRKIAMSFCEELKRRNLRVEIRREPATA